MSRTSSMRGIEVRLPRQLVRALRRSWRSIEKAPKAKRKQAIRQVRQYLRSNLEKFALAWALKGSSRWQKLTRQTALALVWLSLRVKEQD